MKLQHAAFRGEIPILDPRLLPENNAQVARNLDLRRGTLRPQRDTLAAGQLPANRARPRAGGDRGRPTAGNQSAKAPLRPGARGAAFRPGV